MKHLLNIYEKEAECDYKGEHYSVRDNGAVLRHSKNLSHPRPLDNIWMFGRKDDKDGYMFIGSERVHRIVATAFLGLPDDSTMVVGHKDTNRCNNRIENLEWITRLEMALNNPIIRKRIILCCGSVEAFIENPSLLKENAKDSNITWMRTVSKEEADRCKKHLERWAAEDSIPKGCEIGDWVYYSNTDLYSFDFWNGRRKRNSYNPTQQKIKRAKINVDVKEAYHMNKESHIYDKRQHKIPPQLSNKSSFKEKLIGWLLRLKRIFTF